MLYLICTPIGNLNDLSLRSINTLKEVDCIYAEDTRVSAKLFQHFKISRKSVPFHEHNEIKQIMDAQTVIDEILVANSDAVQRINKEILSWHPSRETRNYNPIW